MPYITINTDATNLIQFQSQESGEHYSAFLCGGSFYQKLTEGENPTPSYKLFTSAQEVISKFNNQVLAGTSSGFGGTGAFGFSGGSTLDRELHSVLNYLTNGNGIIAIGTGATALSSTDLPIDTVFCEDRTKFNDVINLVAIRQDCIGILGASYEYHNGSTGTYPTGLTAISLIGITGVIGATLYDELFYSVIGRKSTNRMYGQGQTGPISILLGSDVAAAFSRTDFAGNPWLAPAGTLRGGFFALDYEPKLSEADLYTLYETYGVNAPKKVFGLDNPFIWGDATQEATDTLRMQVGISRLILHIKRLIKPLLESVLFGPNTTEVRRNLTNSINTFMSEIQRKNGISGYNVICDETNNSKDVIDARRLVVDLSFKPYQSIETITFRFTVNRD